jgi:hypothetical protein
MIKPLLEMKSIPMSIEYKINNAHYEIVNVNVPVEITQNDNGYQLKMEPTKLNLDTVEINNNAVLSVGNILENDKTALYEVSSSNEDKGNIILDIKILNSASSKIAFRKFESDVNFNFKSYQPQDISIKYDFNNFNLNNSNNSQFKFIPGNIEFIIKEYPRIEIKYLGDPIYVPESANPNYKPIDKLI